MKRLLEFLTKLLRPTRKVEPSPMAPPPSVYPQTHEVLRNGMDGPYKTTITVVQKTNPAGLELIKSFEGCSFTSYPDDASELANACIAAKILLTKYEKMEGWESLDGTPWTIGYGATGSDIHPGMTWTQAQCDQRLAQELDEHEEYVRRFVKVPLTSNQFAALTSFTYNCGPTNLRRLIDGTNLNDAVNNPQVYQICADRLLVYNKARGNAMLGLTRRRQAERDLFLKEEIT